MENIYAALLLHKAGKDVNEENIKIKSLIASLNGVDIDKELESASVMSSAPAGGANAPAKEEKKEAAPKEEKKEAAAEGLSALFG